MAATISTTRKARIVRQVGSIRHGVSDHASSH
jgi:hypothetical protein